MTADRRPLVLVGFADALAAVETVWSLADAGFRVAAVMAAGSRPPLRHSRSASLHTVTSPRTDAEATARDVHALIDDLRPDVVLPLDDDMVWVLETLAARGGTRPAPSGDAPSLALDKRLQLRAAERAGFRVPATVVTEADGDWPPDLAYPVIVKPALAVEVEGGALTRQSGIVCRDAAQLAEARGRLRPPLLVQPLIAGQGVGVFGLATDEGIVGISGHERIRMMNPQGSGASASRSRDVEPDAAKATEQFCRDTGWRGLFMIELLRDEAGTEWFMELNGRAWGSMALALARGFAYPAWTVQQRLGGALDPAPPVGPPVVQARHLGRELVHLAFVVRGPASPPDPTWPRIGPTLRRMAVLRRGDRWYNWRLREPRVFLADTVRTVAAKVRRR
jgi:hypothetical protein